MIRHFVFDIGNVILTFDFGLSAARLAPLSRLPEAEILPALQPLQIDIETGRISTADFAVQGKEWIGYSGSDDSFIHAFQDIFTVNEPIAALVDVLSGEGHPLYLLSNTSDLHVNWFTRQYEVFDRFHGAIYSHEARCMKPEPGIFHHAIERYGLPPEETVYIDDLPANVAAAEAIGFNGLTYDHRNHGDFLSRFASLTGISG